MKCFLCHLAFRPETRFHGADEVYAVYCGAGNYNYFHMGCFTQTSQGSQGQRPTFRFFYYDGYPNPQADLFTQRNKPV